VSSPSHQIRELQPRPTELVIEPDTEVVQRNPRRQSGTQTLDLVGTLPPEAEGVEEFVVDRFDDLRYPGNPPPKRLGPGLFGVALGRMNYLRSVVIEPAAMVFSAFEAFVGYISSREGRAHAVMSLGFGLALRLKNVSCKRLVGAGGGTEAKARDHSGGLNGTQKGEALVPSYTLDQPMSASPASQPYPRRLASRIWAWQNCPGPRKSTFWGLQHPCEVQGHLLDEVRFRAQEAVELGAIRKGREGLSLRWPEA
jgi:hypothetical protein